jgi:hypothetical protein
MVQSRVFLGIFELNKKDDNKVNRREYLYGQILKSSFEDENLLKIGILKEHV